MKLNLDPDVFLFSDSQIVQERILTTCFALGFMQALSMVKKKRRCAGFLEYRQNS